MFAHLSSRLFLLRVVNQEAGLVEEDNGMG